MDFILQRWNRLCDSSGPLRFIDINLRGIGQVLFQDNPLSGLLFLIAIGWGALASGRPDVLAGSLLALIAGTTTAICLRADEKPLRQGLYGYNALLIGLALNFFLGPGPAVMAYGALAGAVTAIAMLGTLNARMPWSVPAHAYPFIFGTWIFLLAAYGFSGIPGEGLPRIEELPPLDPTGTTAARLLEFLSVVLSSISQIYFKDHAIAALLILAGLAVNSTAAAAFAFCGALIAVVTAHIFGVESALISTGVQGFSPVLTAVAFTTVFYRPSLRVAVYAALATVVTVITQSALNTLLTPLNLPPLAAPFQLVALLFFIREADIKEEADSGPVANDQSEGA